jgi:predicted  nucleic acid-binding Zn-ribbon protein
MSTAGKVLAVLVLLASVGWIILAAGIAQLNANGNKRLHDLEVQIEKLQDDLRQTVSDISSLKVQTSQTQEHTDRDLAVLRSRQANVEKARSQIRESFARAQYQLAIVQETIKGAQDALQHRNEEHQSEEKALGDVKSDVRNLVAETNQLRDRLMTLRKEFQTTYHDNVETLGARTR